MNFTNEGINILKKLARYEMIINHNLKKNKTSNFGIENFNFFSRFGKLYGLLIYLINDRIGINEATQEQREMIYRQAKKFHFIGKRKYYKEKNTIKRKKGAIKKAKTKKSYKKCIKASS